MFTLTFFGDDGEFRYVYGTSAVIEHLFRNPRVHCLSWTFDGDGWISSTVFFAETKRSGAWYISREV